MSLEDKVRDSGSKRFIKKALRLGWKLGTAAATTALSTSLVGNLGILVGAGFAGGGAMANLAKGKSVYESLDRALTTYSAVNAVIYPMVWLGDVTFPLIQNQALAGKLMRGLYASTAYNAVFLGGFRGASHLIDNYLNPSGMKKSLTENFLRDWAAIGLLFSPFYYLAANNITSLGVYQPNIGEYMLPTFAVGAPAVGFAHNKWVAEK